MNAERLLALFEEISEAPDAIPRLRRFILDLAVRGKLVEQDPEDEPAEEQLARIIEAKILLARRERRTKKKRSELANESLDFPFPARWSTAPLADLVTILNGRAYKQSELLDAGTPVLRVGNLFTSNKWYYSNLELEEDKYCHDGDLIFAWSASFGPFIWSGGRAIYHYHIWKLPLHSPDDLSRDYLYLYLLNKTDEIKASGHGISMVHMTKEKMERLEVPLPPLAEQQRIVAKVDELMALCDQLEAARQQREQCRERLVASTLQRLNQPSDEPEAFRSDARFALQVLPIFTSSPAQIKQLRQTILNLAVRGKLVEQYPGEELSDHLDWELQIPFEVPFCWQIVRLGTIFKMVNGRAFKPTDWITQGLPIVRIQNLNNIAATFNYCDPELVDDKHLIDNGTFLISWSGTPGTSFGAFIWGRGSAALNQHIFKCVHKTKAYCNSFLRLAINGRLDELIKKAQGGVGLQHVTKGKLEALTLPLPPLAEQHRIVAKVDELMALCDQLEQQLSQAEQSRRGLLEAVLREALEDEIPEATPSP